MKIRTCIADDEPLARERLRTLLKTEADLEIVSECSNGEEARTALSEGQIDVVFLDVRMPGLNGFEVLQSLPKEHQPFVIFVTAYDEHAVRAFEVEALHYLLKPYKQAALREAVARARAAIASSPSHPAGAATPAAQGRMHRIPVRSSGRVLFVRTEQVDWIESAGNYAVLHCGKENHVIRQTMRGLEESLPPDSFLRVSRSALVNRDRVRELQPVFGGEHVVVLLDGTRIAMTRGLREVEQHLTFS